MLSWQQDYDNDFRHRMELCHEGDLGTSASVQVWLEGTEMCFGCKETRDAL